MIRKWDKSKPPSGAFTLNKGCLQAQGLAAWYPLGGAGGNFLADMAGSNHMTINGSGFVRDAWGSAALAMNGTSDSAKSSVAAVTAHPLSMSSWAMPTDLSAYYHTVGVSFAGARGSQLNFAFMLIGVTTGLVSAFETGNSGSGAAATTAVGMVAGQWGLLGGRFTAVNSRTAYLNGVASAVDTTTIDDFAGIDTTSLGVFYIDAGTLYWLKGQIGESCLWNIDVGDDVMKRIADPGLRFELWYPLRSAKWISFPSAGIAFDAASNSGYQAAQSTYTFNRTCTGSDRFLAVDIGILSAGQTVTSVVDDSAGGAVAMTLIGARSTVTSFGRIESWGLVAPATGTKSIQVNLSGTVISAAEAVSYTGVNQTVPTEAFSSAQATDIGQGFASVNLTTIADNDWLHGAIAASDAAITTTFTSRNNVSGAGGSVADADDGPLTPPGINVISWDDIALGTTWAIAAYALRPVSASSGIALTGVSGTGAPGTLTPNITLALSGVGVVGAVGSLSPATTLALAGVAGAGSAGSLAAVLNLSLSGVAGTGAVGTLYPEISLTGVEGTGGVGSPTPGFSLGLSGVSGAGAVGTLTPTTDISVALTGVSATGSAGTMVPGISKAITGVLGSGAVGVLIPGGAILGCTIDSPIILTPAILGGTIRPDSAGYLANDGSPGINATITTGSLAGKTITVKDGIIVGFS